MKYRSTLLAIALAAAFPLIAPAGDPIYDRRPGHPWDEVRDIFYLRRFSTGETFEDPHTFEPPWREYFPFVLDDNFNHQVIERLETVEQLPKAQMEDQAASRRLVFLRDLWGAFDGLDEVDNKWDRLDETREVVTKALARRDDLLHRLARIMKRLELSEEEVHSLPNAFDILRESKLYANSIDLSTGNRAFVPTDVFDKGSPWVAYSSEPEPSAGGEAHATFFRNRSAFTLHLRAPDGREGGLRFLEEYTTSRRQRNVPPGTKLALVRRALVPTRSGKLLVSPVIESLQLIVVTPPEDHRFKFTFDRKEFLAGNSGLKLLDGMDPVDISNFESITFLPHPVEPRMYDANGETLILTKYKTLGELPRSLDSCVRCHDDTFGNVLFGRSGPRLAYGQSDLAAVDASVVKTKEAGKEWELYLRLRNAPGK